MLKKKLSILSLISLLVLFLGLSSTTYATFSNSTLQDLNDNLQVLQDKGLLSQDFMQNFNYSNPYWGQHYIILITNESVDNVYIAYGYNGTKIINRDTTYWKTNGDTVTNVGATKYKNKNGSNNGVSSTSWGAYPGNNYTYVYAYSPYYEIDTTALTLNAGEEFGGNYITSSFSFIPENIYQTTGTPQLNVNKFDYKSKRVKLGELESTDYYLIDVKFKDENGLILGSDGTLSNQLTSSSIEWESNALYRNRLNFYANTVYLNYERPYLLTIDVYEDRFTYNTYEYYYIFYPPNAVIESGTVVSAGSGDFNSQDNALAITESINNFSNQFFNTTIPSGEEPTLEDLSVPEVNDPTEDFFTWLLTNIEDILIDTSDTTLTIPLYNTTHTIRSDVFKLTIEPLKTFVSAGWYFIVGVPLLKYIRRSIERLKGGDLPATDEKSDLLGNIL